MERHLEREPEEEGAEAGTEREVFRVVVGLELSRTGRVRADLRLREKDLGVRFLVARPALARHLEGAFGALAERLNAAGFRVRITAGVGAEALLEKFRGFLDCITPPEGERRCRDFVAWIEDLVGDAPDSEDRTTAPVGLDVALVDRDLAALRRKAARLWQIIMRDR